MKKIDLTGQRFGKLLVVKEVEPRIGFDRGNLVKKYNWLCLCDCGGSANRLLSSLRSGRAISCGCISKDSTLKKNYIHGEGKKGSKEYRAWLKIKGRCYCKTDAKYKDYGGRGIKVCDRWMYSYVNFLHDMGRRPDDKHSIERINNNGDYEPSNCRWATLTEQAQNKRTSIVIEMGGIAMGLAQWCKELGFKYEPTRRKIRNKNKTLQELVGIN
jgi:hypothetical protein